MCDNNNKTKEIYEILKRRIINLDYEPGFILNESDLADEFNISRAPVRSALRLLMIDKLVKIVPRFGAQVSTIDFKQMRFVFELTRVLDPFAARLAAERISDEGIKELEEIMERIKSYKEISRDYQDAIADDERFHNIIYSSCGNPWLKDILTNLHYHTERLWHYCESFFDSIDFKASPMDMLLILTPIILNLSICYFLLYFLIIQLLITVTLVNLATKNRPYRSLPVSNVTLRTVPSVTLRTIPLATVGH
jgi:DNA-binding GntR family transcriptional regulator